MATTHSISYGLKKIGQFLEAGTWGASTNENWERISATIGDARSLDIQNMPNGSTSVTLPNGATPATWILVDSADSGTSVNGEDGSQGRCSAVEFRSTDTVTGTTTVNIRGSASGTSVNRILVVKNGMTGTEDLVINNGGGTYTIKTGRYAMLALRSVTDDGTFTAGVHNLMESLQIDDLYLGTAGGNIEFGGDGVFTIPTASVAALKLNDGVTDLLTVDTTNEKFIFESATDIGFDFGLVNAVVDLGGDSEALLIQGAGNHPKMTFDTTLSQIITGSVLSNMDLRIWGDLWMDDQASDIIIKDSTSDAIQINDTSANEYLAITTATAATDRRVNAIVPVTAPDIELTGTDGYILGTPAADPTDLAAGYGIRNFSGTMQSKNDSGSWSNLLQIVVATAASAATSLGGSGAGENKKFTLDLGPYRLVVDTVDVNATTDITLTELDSVVYAVMVCPAESMGGSTGNISGWVKTSASRIITLVEDAGGGPFEITYFAVGDSGA